MAGVQKSAVKNVSKSAVTSAVKSAADKPIGYGGMTVGKLRSIVDAEARKSSRGKSSYRRDDVADLLQDMQNAVREKAKPLGKPKDTGSTAREMSEEVSNNDPALAAMLAAKKPPRRVGGRKPKSYPEMTTAYSSNVDGISYDAEKQQMFITFRNGSVYQYFEVPDNIYQDLLYTVNSGGSVGARFWDLIRVRGKGNSYKTKYSYRQIKGENTNLWWIKKKKRR